MGRRKLQPKRSVGPSTRSERQIIANKCRRRIERKALKYRHKLWEEAE
jgi:hypothetical protein